MLTTISERPELQLKVRFSDEVEVRVVSRHIEQGRTLYDWVAEKTESQREETSRILHDWMADLKRAWKKSCARLHGAFHKPRASDCVDLEWMKRQQRW